MKCLLVVLTVLMLAGCASMVDDPSLVAGVQRAGSGIYTTTSLSIWVTDPTTTAVKQCALDNKPLNIIASTTDSSGKYPKLVFRCGGNGKNMG